MFSSLRRIRLRDIVQLTDTPLLNTTVLPQLPRSVLICNPAHEAQHHAEAQQQEGNKSAPEREFALAANGCEVAVAHVGRDVHVLPQR